MPLGQVPKHLHLMNQMNLFKGPLKETFNFKINEEYPIIIKGVYIQILYKLKLESLRL